MRDGYMYIHVYILPCQVHVPIVCAFLPSLQVGPCTTPLQLACYCGREGVVEVLLNHNVHVEQLSGVSPTYVHVIVYKTFVSHEWAKDMLREVVCNYV